MTREHRTYRFLFATFIVAVVALAWYYRDRIARETRDETQQVLTSLLATSVEALHGWTHSCEQLASHVAAEERLLELVSALAATVPAHEWSTAPEQQAIRKLFDRYETWAEIEDFQLISPDNRIMAATDTGLVGEPAGSLVLAEYLDGIRRGKSTFSVNSSIDAKAPEPGLYSYAAVGDSGMVLALSMRPTAPVMKLLTEARPGRTGEAYLFDRQGLMLTDSRFREQLQSIGLLAPGEQASFNVHVRDPGADLTAGAPLPPDLGRRPLTLMAASATRGESGSDLEGYRDYRGVIVVGAWAWLEDHGFGIAVEMDYDEAMEEVTHGTLAIMGFSASIVLLIVLLFIALTMLHRLREQHGLVESIVEALPGMFFMLDGEGRAVRWNRAVTEAMDDPPEKGLQLPLEFWVRERHRSRVREHVERALDEGSASFEADFVARNRLLKPFYVHAARTELDDDTCLLVIALEITDLKRAQHELAEARSRAEAASVAKTRFLANMSHEIRTPLNGVIGMLELMADTRDVDTFKGYLDICQASAELLLQVISDILNISEIEAGKLELKQAPFDLDAVLERVFRTVTPQAREKSLQLSRSVDPDVPSPLIGDDARLSQVLLNLVGNAVKFTHEGEISVTVAVDERRTGRVRLAFAVRDTGIGIPRNRQQTIFEPFEQQDTSSSRAYGGTGLGLTISRSLVELMGGEIAVHSDPGVGSTFRFTAWFGTELA